MATSKRRLRLGVLVPSSNTVLEPITQQMVDSFNDEHLAITAHFSRFRVIKIALSADSNAQFTRQAMLEAARLLADAHVDVIGWSGTSASWLGFPADESLCANIEEVTGIPATSSVLAMNSQLSRSLKVTTNVGLVTPYTKDVNVAIQENYSKSMGITITDLRSRCAGLSENMSFADLDERRLDAMVSEVVQNGAEIVLIMCTNVRGAQRAKYWEATHGIRVLDSVATVVAGMLEKLSIPINPKSVETWGNVFLAV